jgi:hypothetical protein
VFNFPVLTVEMADKSPDDPQFLEQEIKIGQEEYDLQMMRLSVEKRASASAPQSILPFTQRLQRIQSLYENCLIPELDIITTSSEELYRKLEFLSNLRNLCVQQFTTIKAEDDDLIALMGRIGRDMELYEHFAKLNSLKKESDEEEYLDEQVDVLDHASSVASNHNQRRESVHSAGMRSRIVSIAESMTQETNADTPKPLTRDSISRIDNSMFNWNLLVDFSPHTDDYGLITTFLIANIVVCGTSNSLVLLFDTQQVLLAVLRSNIEGINIS